MSHTEPADIDAVAATLTPVISVRPVTVTAPGRGDDLRGVAFSRGERETK